MRRPNTGTPDCGCIVTYSHNGDYILWCPMHEAAGEMLEALELTSKAISYDSKEAAEAGKYGLPPTAFWSVHKALNTAKGIKSPTIN